MRLLPGFLKAISFLVIIGLFIAELVSPMHVQAASVTVTFTASEDAYTNQRFPDQNYGDSSMLEVDGSPVKLTYLRFQVSGLSGYTVASARLNLFTKSTLSAGFSVDQETDHNWTETGITYNNAPAPGELLNSTSGVMGETWVPVDVTPVISTDGTYDFVLSALSSTKLDLASRETGSNAPQLVLVLIPNTSTATSTPTMTGTATYTPIPSTATFTATPAPATATDTATLTSPPPTATNTPTLVPATSTSTPTLTPPAATVTPTPTFTSLPPTPTSTSTPTPTPTSTPSIPQPPNFSHVITLILENREYSSVLGSASWPNFNRLAQQSTLLTKDYAVTHPSLPNYLALTGGSTQGISSDCTTCWVNAANIADTVDTSGRSWKGYMESMPAPCYLGNSGSYAQKHNPFVYYNDIRTNPSRCQQHDVPLTQLATDLANNQLPAYAWITPNLCDDGHDCSDSTADTWLGKEVNQILSSSAFDANSLLIVTFDEGTTDASCCGLPASAGGQIATLLIGNLVKAGYQDSTAYDHYSLLKTIEAAWGLPSLGQEADSGTNTILAPWK
jgi:hypothetical protein